MSRNIEIMNAGVTSLVHLRHALLNGHDSAVELADRLYEAGDPHRATQLTWAARDASNLAKAIGELAI